MSWRGTLLFVLATCASDAVACSCVDADVEDQLDRAQTIALVRIRAVEVNPVWLEQLSSERPDAMPLRAEAEVLEVLRGAPTAAVRLLGGAGDGGCALPLTPGEDVLLVDAGAGDEFELHLCSASRVLGVGSLLEAAGRPVRPTHPRLFVQALRDYLARGTPIHECLRGSVPPPPPPPDADPADAGPNCWELLSPAPAESAR